MDHVRAARACCLLATFTTLAASAAAQRPAPESDWDTAREYLTRERPDGARYVADELLIGWRSDADRAALHEVVAARGCELLGEFAGLRVMRVRLPAQLDPLQAAPEFAAYEGVLYAEPNDVGEGGYLGGSNDTHYGSQWHHENTGQSGGLVGADIETPSAWALVSNPQPVVLAVLDSGIDFVHPEFIGRVVPGWDYVNEDPDATADHPHGIWCAGLAAAKVGNSFGVAGVDAHCTIYPIKVLNASNGGNVTDLVQALNHCAAAQVEVVSMSLINYGSSSTLENGLIAARNAGCILIACAGNGGIGNADVSGPGQSAQTMSIGATGNNDWRASFSGTGSKLDFVAPGASVRTVSITHNDQADLFSGCSAATPVVAGLVATLVSQDSSLTHDQVFDLLKAGAEDLVGKPSEDTPGRDDFMGWGRVNAYRTRTALAGCSPIVYCTAGLTTNGCTASMSTSGTPSVAATSGFVLHCTAMEGQKTALMYYGISGLKAVVWQPGSTSYACVKTPTQRLSTTNPGGTLDTCDGAISEDWLAYLTAHSGALGQPFTAGETVNVQTWFRDPLAAGTTNLSNAVQFTTCP